MPNWTASIEDRDTKSGQVIMQTAPDRAVNHMNVSVSEFIMIQTHSRSISRLMNLQFDRASPLEDTSPNAQHKVAAPLNRPPPPCCG